jgi:PhnB protein
MAEFKTTFAPMLIHRDGIAAIEFYKKAFGAVEVVRYSNDDGSIHVAELSIGGAMFHIREESAEKQHFSPATIGGVTAQIELLVEDPHAMHSSAVAAGATEIHPVTDYDYNFRQGIVRDPFGHFWLIERKINE